MSQQRTKESTPRVDLGNSIPQNRAAQLSAEARPPRSTLGVRYILIIVFLFADIFIWSVVMRADRAGVLTVAFLDVGQGDAIYIEAPNGNQVLIDGGPGAKTLRSLGNVVPFYDRSLDLVIATHPDQDHIGGLPAVLERMSVLGVMTSENATETGAYSAFEKIIQTKNLHRILARRGEKIILDQGVVLEILFPDRSTFGWDTNTGSIVARLTYGDVSFLFTGDSPSSIEHYLAGKDGAHLQTNVLKLGHHGSRTSSSREFLSVVDPEYAIVSAGRDNKYGHPNKDVTALLEELKIPTLSTVDKGTVIFKTDGTSLRVR